MSFFSHNSKSKKTKIVVQFMSVTQASNETATAVLSKHRYSMDAALEHYFINRHLYPDTDPPKPSKDKISKLNKLFEKYADEDEKDETSEDGLVQFYKDVGIDPNKKESLLVAYKLELSTMGEITRKEFVDGFSSMKAFTLKDIKKSCEKECKYILSSDDHFDKFYKWLYNFVKENPDKRSIPKDVALQLWTVVLGDNEYPLLKVFLEFCTTKDDLKSITMDTWTNVRKFLKTCRDTKGFVNDGAWPILVDEFLDSREE